MGGSSCKVCVMNDTENFLSLRDNEARMVFCRLRGIVPPGESRILKLKGSSSNGGWQRRARAARAIASIRGRVEGSGLGSGTRSCRCVRCRSDRPGRADPRRRRWGFGARDDRQRQCHDRQGFHGAGVRLHRNLAAPAGGRDEDLSSTARLRPFRHGASRGERPSGIGGVVWILRRAPEFDLGIEIFARESLPAAPGALLAGFEEEASVLFHLQRPFPHSDKFAGRRVWSSFGVGRDSGTEWIDRAFVLAVHKSVRMEPHSFEIEGDQIDSLDRAISEIDELLATGLFQRCIHEDFQLHLEKEELKDNIPFLEEVSLGIRTAIVKILNTIETSREQPEDREKLVGFLGVFVVYLWISGESSDKKTLKLISKLAANYPVLHPISNVRFLPIEFLTSHSPSWFRATTFFRDVRRDAIALKRNYLSRLDIGLVESSNETHREVCDWMISFNSLASSPPAMHLSNQSVLDMHLQQGMLGILLANKLQKFVRAVIDLHVLLEAPISKDQVRRLRYGMELLKAVECMFNKMEQQLALTVGQIVCHFMSLVRRRLLQFKSTLAEDLNARLKGSNTMFNRSPSKIREPELKLMDALCALNVAIAALDCLPTVNGFVTFRLAFDAVTSLQQSKVEDDHMKEIENYVALMELALNRENLVHMVTDCSFLLWNRELMSTCFSMVYSQADEARHLQYLISAFLDGAKLLQSGCADASSYEKSIKDCLFTEVIEPICHDIETDLRLHVHSAHLKGAVNVDPTKTGVRDLSWFLKLKPLRLLSTLIHIKSRVEIYLNAAYYDHAAVALHNWKTYNEMKNLADLKYGLVLDGIHLPGQTLEQGVDVLEIMRNIHIFVACYTYNLNTQVFVERPSNAQNRKNLNTVSVKHAANSIRTHGTGIMSTTVNFAYQFLAQKFVVFSQFLFDDHIKSRMVKEQRFYKEEKLQADSGYPVSRAEKMNKDIKKLGLTNDGLSFLDQFRRLIAEMGNALGFVRMVRLGGLHYCSNAGGFTGLSQSYEEAAKAFSFTEPGIDAGVLLDKALASQNLSLNETDYFAILTNIFSELRSNENIHLRDFFVLVPALTINAADAILQSKEKLNKRGRDSANAVFTDDGFALGIAYILKVLDQDKQFDSLHWFQSARTHFVSERSRLEEKLDMDSTGGGMNGLQAWSQKLASLSKEEAQNMQMIMKKLTAMLTEVELIEFTFTGARVFF